MTAAPFNLTALTKEVLTALMETDKPLCVAEVTQQTGSAQHHVVKSLMRMQLTGWVECDVTRRETGGPFMGFSLKEEYRPQAKSILEPKAEK